MPESVTTNPAAGKDVRCFCITLEWNCFTKVTDTSEDGVSTVLSEEEIGSKIHDAMVEVLAEQAEEMSRPYPPPLSGLPEPFMRPFQPFTGVGNREDLFINSVRPLEVYPERESSRFLYLRFNSTDHVAGLSRNHVVLHRIDPHAQYLELAADDAVTIRFDDSAIVKDAVLFTKVTKRVETLFVAALVEHQKTIVVNVYEIFRNQAVVVAAIELNKNPVKTPLKIAYVQSSLGSSIAVLMRTVETQELNFKQAGSTEANHYIEVSYPGAVDMTTFSVQGHGYIAVAGTSYCDVFKLSESAKEYLDFGRIGPLFGIADLAYFRIGFQHVLVVSSYDGVRLYSWTSGEFVLKQTIRAPGVLHVYTALVDSCRDEVLLLMVEDGGKSSFYTYKGREEVFQRADVAVPEGHLIVPGSVTSFTVNQKVMILFFSVHQDARAFVIETSLKPLRDPVKVETENLAHIVEEIQSTLDNQAREINHIREVLKSAVRSRGGQHISGLQRFEKIVATAAVEVQEVNEIIVEWQDSELTLDEYRRGVGDLEKEIERLESLVQDIEEVLPDVVLQDQSTVITGQKIFTGTVVAETLMATSLNIGKVGDVDMKQLQKDIYRLDKPLKIEGALTFVQPLTVNGDLEVETTVNGIDISEEVMTTDTEQVSKAQIVFANPLTIEGSLDLSGKVNGVDLSEEVVTLHGDYHVRGSKTFLNGIEVEDMHTVHLDGVHVDELYRQAFTKSGDQSVSADVTISSVTTGDIQLGGLLNGHDVLRLESEIVRVDRPAVITGLKTFTSDVFVEGNCVVYGTVNGLRIPDDLFLTDISNTVTGKKDFQGHVIAHHVMVDDTIDGLKIPEDVVTLTGNEEISANMYFTDGIDAKKDIKVEGLVDGVDISDMAKQALKLNETHVLPNTIFSGPVTVLGDLDVDGLINNVNLKELVDDIVFVDEGPIEIRSRKNFKKVTAGRVNLESTLNGYNIDVDFMKVYGDQEINGVKTFLNKVYLNSVVISDDKIGGVNISDIYRQRVELYLDESEISNDIEFLDTVTVQGNLKVVGKINGIRFPEDVVLKNSQQPIFNKHFAGPVKVDNLIVDGNIQATKFGGWDLSQFFRDRITLSSDQAIPSDLYLGSSSVDKLAVSGLVNGVNFADFAANVMSKTREQVITAPKVFTGSVTVHEPITTGGGVNGLNLTDINRRAFKLEDDNVVTAHMHFKDDVSFTKLNVLEVSGVNMTRLAEDSLKKTAGLQVVKGEVTFAEGFTVEGDINANSVNGLFLPEDVLLKSRPQEITGLFTFDSAEVEGDITVTGTVNGLDLANLAPQVALIESETVIESNVTFLKPVHVYQNVDVSGKVNDVDLKQLFDNVLKRTGDQDITGRKVFKGSVTVEGDMDVQYVNGMNWKEFLGDVVWTHMPQVVKSPKTFEKISAANMNVAGDASAKVINGIDLQKFVDEAVFLDTPTSISGTLVFKSPVEITGDLNADLINGLNLHKDVVTIECSHGEGEDHGPQIITGQKTFQNLKVFGDVYADTVNSHDLQKLYADTLLTEGDQTVTGHKTISGDVIFQADVHPNTVNGMVLSRDLVTLNTDQEIGPVTFLGDVFVAKDLTIGGTLNGIDLQALARDAVYLDRQQQIDGAYTFEKAVALQGVEVDGTVNGVDLKAFDKNVTEFLRSTKDSLEVMSRFAQDHCELVGFLQESLKKSYYGLDYFELHQELQAPATFVQLHQGDSLSLTYLDDTATKATTVSLVWSAEEEAFQVQGSSETDLAKTFHLKIGNLELVVNIGINSKDSSVFIQGAPSNIPAGFVEASVLEKDPAVVALLFPEKGSCDVYVVKESGGHYVAELETSQVIGKKATSVVLFELSGVLYLAVSNSQLSTYLKGSSEIYSRSSAGWQKVQELPLYSSSFVRHFVQNRYHYLVFGSNAPVYETKEPMSLQVFRNSGPNEYKFRLFQKLPFAGVAGIEFFRFGDLGQLHAVAWNGTVVQVLGLEGESGFQALLTIHGQCIKDVKPLFLGKDLYLVVGQHDLKSGEPMKTIVYKGLAKGVLYEPHKMEYC